MTIRNWGPEQLVDTAGAAAIVHNPDIVALPDGSFSSSGRIWTASPSPPFQPSTCSAMTPMATSFGDKMLLGTGLAPGHVLHPTVELLSTGDFVMAWGGGSTLEFGAAVAIKFRRFEADGTPIDTRLRNS